MTTPIEEDWLRAYSPNGKAVDENKMPPNIKQMMRVFFYNGWVMGAGRVMQAGRLVDQTQQMLKIMEIMDCIEHDADFLGVEKEKLTGPENPNEDLPTFN